MKYINYGKGDTLAQKSRVSPLPQEKKKIGFGMVRGDQDSIKTAGSESISGQKLRMKENGALHRRMYRAYVSRGGQLPYRAGNAFSRFSFSNLIMPTIKIS
eukprot:1148196-Pelagomonas_calceolata.AAC.1